MKFSQRKGIIAATKEIQLEDIDNDLRMGLWNIFYNSFMLKLAAVDPDPYGYTNYYENSFASTFWHDYLKKDVSNITKRNSDLISSFRILFTNSQWYEIYDIIEFTISYLLMNPIYSIEIKVLVENFNNVLQREFSGYRLINCTVVPISNDQELKELREVFTTTESFTALNSCNIHLKAALSKLSDRINPDYRNSIKESISAVESLAKVISGRSSDTLGSALDRIKGKTKLNAKLELGFKNIYNYTSDEGGIRHALMEDPNCDFEDAKFMLISCSAFINYLIVKANKAGINLQ